MGHLQTGKNLSKQGKTFPNREKHHQTSKNLSKQGKPFQTRKTLSKQGKTPPNKEKHHQTRKNLSKQENRLSSKKTAFQARKIPSRTRKTPFEQGKVFQASMGYLPLKYRSLQVVGVFRQGKAVVSDGGYGVIGGRYCLLVWGDAEETKGKRWRRWRGVGPAGRPFPILLWR
jgi:hypothetical protein